MAKITGKYEVLYIIDPAVGEEGIQALVEKFKAIVEDHGTLNSIDEWGKRRLAFSDYGCGRVREAATCSITSFSWAG